MGKVGWIWVLAVSALGFGLRPLWAGPGRGEVPAQPKITQGSIASVNLATQRIQVEQRDGTRASYYFDSGTRVLFEGRTGTIHELQAGQFVALQQVDPSGQGNISSIRVKP